MSNEGFIGGGDDFVTDNDTVDDCFWMERQNVIGNPRLCCRQLRERRDITIFGGDSDGDASVGKGVENVGVAIKDFDAVDGGLGFEEVGDFGWWREVVGDGAVVDADGVGSGRETENQIAS